MKFKLFIVFLSLLLLNSFTPSTHQEPTIWQQLRDEFSINHEVNRTEIQRQIKWLLAHPGYLNQLTTQSKPYLYYVLQEIKKRHLPGELALIPMIESGYDPFSYSHAGAAGIWQIMPHTGSDYGLKRDWWIDTRRSIRPSTTAALNYLEYLNHFFKKDWALALGAYDSGEGTVARSMGRNRFKRFWNLSLPHETKTYVPRLFALAEIIQNPRRYHIKLPDIPHKPYFEEIKLKNQIDLNQAAKLAEIPYPELIRLNPGYNRWATAPDKPCTLLIPSEKVAHFKRNLATIPSNQLLSFEKHTVRHGENLSSLSMKYNISTTLLKTINQLKSDHVKTGQIVFIPHNKNAIHTLEKLTANKKQKNTFVYPSQYRVLHIVDEGESLRSIQKKYGVTTEQIKTWNQLTTLTQIKPGQQLVIWKEDPQKSNDNIATAAMVASLGKVMVHRIFVSSKCFEKIVLNQEKA